MKFFENRKDESYLWNHDPAEMLGSRTIDKSLLSFDVLRIFGGPIRILARPGRSLDSSFPVYREAFFMPGPVSANKAVSANVRVTGEGS